SWSSRIRLRISSRLKPRSRPRVMKRRRSTSCSEYDRYPLPVRVGDGMRPIRSYYRIVSRWQPLAWEASLIFTLGSLDSVVATDSTIPAPSKREKSMFPIAWRCVLSVLLAVVGLASACSARAADPAAEARQAWQLLDY